MRGFCGLILSRITNALPAWRGQLTRQLQEHLDAFLKQARKFGFCNEHHTIVELLAKANVELFKNVKRPEHCLHHLISDTINSCPMTQRPQILHCSV